MKNRPAVQIVVFVFLFAVVTGAVQASPAPPVIQQISSTGESPVYGKVGGTVVIFGAGFVPPVSALFSDGSTPSVAATISAQDASRGMLAMRVPDGAVTGSMKIVAGGVDSSLFYFRVSPNPFTQGTDVVSGHLTDGVNGVPGAMLALLKSAGCDNNTLWDFTTTDANGAYAMNGVDGAYMLIVLPPVASGLAPAGAMVTLGSDPMTQDFVLSPGTVVTGRIVDASAPTTGIAGARVELKGDIFDTTVTRHR